MSRSRSIKLTPNLILRAYASGIFPMAESAEDPNVFWVEPDERGIIPLENFHIARSLAKLVKRELFDVKINQDFEAIINACGSRKAGREETWINTTIKELYIELHYLGHCHCVGVYEKDTLVGGLYGVHLGAAFFGESMFSFKPNASKIALVHLVARLIAGQFCLLDTQFTTDHLKTMGAIDISRNDYQERLIKAIDDVGDFYALGETVSGIKALEVVTGQDAL